MTQQTDDEDIEGRISSYRAPDSFWEGIRRDQALADWWGWFLVILVGLTAIVFILLTVLALTAPTAHADVDSDVLTPWWQNWGHTTADGGGSGMPSIDAAQPPGGEYPPAGPPGTFQIYCTPPEPPIVRPGPQYYRPDGQCLPRENRWVR